MNSSEYSRELGSRKKCFSRTEFVNTIHFASQFITSLAQFNYKVRILKDLPLQTRSSLNNQFHLSDTIKDPSNSFINTYKHGRMMYQLRNFAMTDRSNANRRILTSYLYIIYYIIIHTYTYTYTHVDSIERFHYCIT